jgi:hypothetical protein
MDFENIIQMFNQMFNLPKTNKTESLNNQDEQFHDNCRTAIADANCLMNPDKTE